MSSLLFFCLCLLLCGVFLFPSCAHLAGASLSFDDEGRATIQSPPPRSREVEAVK